MTDPKPGDSVAEAWFVKVSERIARLNKQKRLCLDMEFIYILELVAEILILQGEIGDGFFDEGDSIL